MAEKTTPPGKVKVYRHNQPKKTGTGVEVFKDEWQWHDDPIKPKFDPTQQKHKP